jgi:hypothetical protein
MHLLFLHSSSDLYGASKILLAINELCSKRGHRATVVLSEDGPLVQKLEAIGAAVVIADLGILRRQYLNPAGILNRLVANIQAYRLLTTLCKSEKIDLIYSNTTGVIVGVFVASKLGIRHLLHIHEIIENPYLLFRILSGLINTIVFLVFLFHYKSLLGCLLFVSRWGFRYCLQYIAIILLQR